MKVAGRTLHVACCLADVKVKPSMWTLTNVAPAHSQEMLQRFGKGLGLVTMEGREQKHQQLKRYMEKSTVKDKWNTVFMHEYIQCVYLREN